MRAVYLFGAGDVRVIDVVEPTIEKPADAVVRVTRACICGTDLHTLHSMPAREDGVRMGHEAVGFVESVGADVSRVKVGDFVVIPFVASDGTCQFCRDGLQTSCEHAGVNPDGERISAMQAEYVRVPLADSTLFVVPGIDEGSALLPSLLTLSDVYGTGHHAAVRAGVTRGDTVTVIGDGAVGLLAVLSAKQLGAERIILMGRHKARTDLGIDFGATDVVAERGEEGIERVRELTRTTDGVQKVLEAVGHMPAYEQAIGIVRSGGVISRVGAPQYETAPVGAASLFNRNITLTGGAAPTREYMPSLLPGILDGLVEPGRVFDRTLDVGDAAAGYQAMDDRSALKVMLTF